MPLARSFPPDIAALEERRADLAARINRLARGSSQRRSLEARQREITRSLLLLETRMDRPAPAETPPLQTVPEHPETEGHELRYFQK